MSETQFRTILVGVADPSSDVQPAVERAAQLATEMEARLVLFHAAFDTALSGRPFFDTKRLAKSRGWYVNDRALLLERYASELRRSGLSVDVAVVWEEPAHEAIVRAALRENADLVVAGRHERSTNRRQQFRLTDWELMRLCPVPLLVTNAEYDPRAYGHVLAALDPAHAHDKPAGLDISILRNAAKVADALQVECDAIHSMTPGAYPLGQVTSADRKRLERRRLLRMKQLIRKAGVEVTAVHVERGSVNKTLVAYARELPAQILVMGIISRRWMKRFVIGDTAETLIRSVPCDVLLIKPDSFRLRLGRVRKESIVLPRKREPRGRRRRRV